MELELIVANLLSRNLDLDENPIDWLSCDIAASQSDIEPFRPTFEITMRFWNRSKPMLFQNRADSRRIQTIHFIDADAKCDWQVLFLSKTREQAVFCAAGSSILPEHRQMVRTV